MSSAGVYANTAKCAKRRVDDFYPTPWEATEAFVRAELSAFQRYCVWEPACGDGAISEVLKRHGCTVISSDLVDRGYGQGSFDFLVERPMLMHPPCAIITNPPYKDLAEAFIRRACGDLNAPYVAMLLKAHYFHAATRRRLFTEHQPTRVYPLSWRLDFTGGGSPHTDCSWYVWERGVHPGFTRCMAPLPKPDPLGLSACTPLTDTPLPEDRKPTLREQGLSPRQMRLSPFERQADAAFERWWKSKPPELRGKKSVARREWRESRKIGEVAA